MALLQFVLDNNFFVFQGNHFQQIFGCPMGSPVSAILANLVMEHVEEKALKWWFPNGGLDTNMIATYV